MARYFTTGTDAAASLEHKRWNLPMIERTIEKLLFACRWLLACDVPGLVARAAGAGHQVLPASRALPDRHPDAGVKLTSYSGVLSLIDLVLVGSSIVMVMLSGYENFVSKLDTGLRTGIPGVVVVLHLTFVVSAVLLGVLDRMAFASHRDSFRPPSDR
jgi:uncharacterized membrane protein YqhA